MHLHAEWQTYTVIYNDGLYTCISMHVHVHVQLAYYTYIVPCTKFTSTCTCMAHTCTCRALTCKVLSCSSVSDVTFESENHTVTERIASGWFLQLGRGSGLDELVICLNCFVSSYIDEAGQNVIDL